MSESGYQYIQTALQQQILLTLILGAALVWSVCWVWVLPHSCHTQHQWLLAVMHGICLNSSAIQVPEQDSELALAYVQDAMLHQVINFAHQTLGPAYGTQGLEKGMHRVPMCKLPHTIRTLCFEVCLFIPM